MPFKHARLAVWAWAVLALQIGVAAAQYAVSGPLLLAERQTSEIQRTVAAEDYRDAYCATWTDGCTVCARASIKDEVTCRPSVAVACQRTPVECRAVLKTIGRVCLAYRDGCNTCSGSGGCTLMACLSVKQSDGTVRKWEPNYRCIHPRQERYDDNANLLRSDLSGHWQLTDPSGRTCEIVNGFPVSLTPRCIALGEPVTEIRSARMSGDTFQLTRSDGETLLSFDAKNPDNLVGTGSSQGYRLVRLEAQAFDPRFWEGYWLLRREGYQCRMFLVMRPHVIGPHPLIDFVQVPHGLSFASDCLDPLDEGRLSLPHMDNARPRLLMPVWNRWYAEGLQIVFTDGEGHVTRFAYNGDSTWSAVVPHTGHPAMMLRLEPMLR